MVLIVLFLSSFIIENEEGGYMNMIKTHKEYINAVFAFSLLSLVGSLFSIVNAITLMTAFQLLQEAQKYGMSNKQETIIHHMLSAALILTLCTTILYISIQW